MFDSNLCANHEIRMHLLELRKNSWVTMVFFQRTKTMFFVFWGFTHMYLNKFLYNQTNTRNVLWIQCTLKQGFPRYTLGFAIRLNTSVIPACKKIGEKNVSNITLEFQVDNLKIKHTSIVVLLRWSTLVYMGFKTLHEDVQRRQYNSLSTLIFIFL